MSGEHSQQKLNIVKNLRTLGNWRLLKGKPLDTA
jgi:hypothetical protein